MQQVALHAFEPASKNFELLEAARVQECFGIFTEFLANIERVDYNKGLMSELSSFEQYMGL